MLIKSFVFAIGLFVGSFLNVCIRRLPEKEPIVFSRSKCMHCKKAIAWYDNIPLVSFMILGGRCRFCKKRISLQYFLVEFLTGIIFLSFYAYYGRSFEFFIFTAFVCLLLVASFTDINKREIPEQVTLPGIAAGIVLSPAHVLDSLAGAILGAGLLYLAGFFGKKAFKKEAMGLGDVELIAMIGAFLGWKAVFVTIFFASLFGSVAGIVMRLKSRQDYVPFGPFLSMGAIVSLFWQDNIIRLITGG